MRNSPEQKQSPELDKLSKFHPGMVVTIKETVEHHINGEYMPIGITGLVEKVENGKVFVAYRIPGKPIKKNGKEHTIFPFNPDEIEELQS